MNEYFTELCIKSVENRVAYLEQRKSEWQESPTEKARFKIIVELIQLEPSHLWEPWIMGYVVIWQRNLNKYRDYIEKAFLGKGARPCKTPSQSAGRAKNMDLALDVEKIQAQDEVSRIDAIRKIVTDSEDDKLPEQAEKALEQRIKRLRQDPYPLSSPYYGRNVTKLPDRFLFRFYDSRIWMKKAGNIWPDCIEFSINTQPEVLAKFDALLSSTSPHLLDK